jgi:hypothetical protein
MWELTFIEYDTLAGHQRYYPRKTCGSLDGANTLEASRQRWKVGRSVRTLVPDHAAATQIVKAVVALPIADGSSIQLGRYRQRVRSVPGSCGTRRANQWYILISWLSGMEEAMRKLALAALGAAGLIILTVGSSSAGWDDSYAYDCCGAYWHRWIYYAGPGYFDRGRWYRSYRRAHFVHHRRYIRARPDRR